MKSLRIFLMLAMLIMALAITLSTTQAKEEFSLVDDNDDDDDDDDDDDNGASNEETSDELPWSRESEEPTISLRGTSRFLAQKTRVVMTCNKYPRVCRVAGSPGPDCCKKKCVNVKTDRLNCGMCGKKCKYSEICCKGKCVNPFSNKKHCGDCNSKCKKGSACVYKMCSYA